MAAMRGIVLVKNPQAAQFLKVQVAPGGELLNGAPAYVPGIVIPQVLHSIRDFFGKFLHDAATEDVTVPVDRANIAGLLRHGLEFATEVSDVLPNDGRVAGA